MFAVNTAAKYRRILFDKAYYDLLAGNDATAVSKVNTAMQSESQLLWGVLFGAVGVGFFTYGRRQKAVVPLLTGIALATAPYFISNVYALMLSGIALLALPYFVRL